MELYSIDSLARDINADNPPTITNSGFSGITLAINMKSEDEVDAFLKTVIKHGGTLVKTARKKVSWGGYSGYFQDLDGYYWEVAYGPN